MKAPRLLQEGKVRLAGRLAPVIVAVAAASCQPQDGLGQFERDAKARWSVAAPRPADANAFRATVCALSPCLLVEAGGLAFVVGAGEGAAEKLAERGLFRSDLDGIILTDLQLGSIEGLPGLMQMSLDRGRTEPLPVYGPEGVIRAVDGTNLLLAGSGPEGARLQVGAEGEDQGLEGKVVFDSGVVTVRAFAATGRRGGRVYRFDVGDKALVVAGCGVVAADVVAAARGTKVAAAVVAVQSDAMLRAEREAARGARAVEGAAQACMPWVDAVAAASEARLAAMVLAPLTPAPAGVASERVWAGQVKVLGEPPVAPGRAGAVLDLTGEKPVITQPK